MKAGKPDTVETEKGRSLVGSLDGGVRAWLRRRSAPGSTSAPPPPRRQRAAAIVALPIAAGPLLTLLGADMLAASARSDARRLNTELAPRIAQERAVAQARGQMGAAIARPMLGATLEAIARALPADAVVLRAERMRDGALELDISAPDPDQLRPALRSLPGIGTFRNTGQRRSDTGMIVSFRAEGA